MQTSAPGGKRQEAGGAPDARPGHRPGHRPDGREKEDRKID